MHYGVNRNRRQATEKEIFQIKIFPFPLPNTSPMLDSHNMTSSNRSSLGQRNNENLLQPVGADTWRLICEFRLPPAAQLR